MFYVACFRAGVGGIEFAYTARPTGAYSLVVYLVNYRGQRVHQYSCGSTTARAAPTATDPYIPAQITCAHALVVK